MGESYGQSKAKVDMENMHFFFTWHHNVLGSLMDF